MSKSSFGDFGKLPKKQISMSSFLKLFLVVTILIALPTAIGGWRKFYVSIAEREAPQISFENPPIGIGLAPVSIKFKVKDSLSGLDKVSVKLKSDNKSITLFEKNYEKRVEEDFLQIELNPKELKLNGKLAILIITAFDRSLWSSSGVLEAEIPVDLKAPKIEVVSTTNYITVGGVGLVFYRISGEKPALSGVILEKDLYFGFSASYIDTIFSSEKNLYFAFFPVPLFCNERPCDFKIYANDIVGNKSNLKFQFDLTTKKYPTSNAEIDSEYITSELPKMVERYNLIKKNATGFTPIHVENNDESRILALPILLRDFNVEQDAKVLFSRPSSARTWVDQFFYPGGSVNKPRFAESLEYTYFGKNVGTLTSPGIFFVSRAGTEIRATNSGRVIFAGDYGILGQTIILDHGFGLSTVYSNLSKFSKLEGDTVTKGDIIALSGTSILENKSGCLYQVRMHGVPVRPEEWWDAGWIKNRIFGQIDEAKKASGLATLQ